MIRHAEERDLMDILVIYNDAILNTTAVYDYQPHTLEDRRQWYQQKRAGGHPVLVSEQEGRIAGFATFGPFRAWPAYKYSIEHSVYVSQNDRKKGIGTSLLKELIAIASVRDYKTLVAGIDAANEISILMHKKFGFTHSGTIKNAGYKFNRWLDLAFYQLDLKGPQQPVEE